MNVPCFYLHYGWIRSIEKLNGQLYRAVGSCFNNMEEFTEEYGDTYITDDFLVTSSKEHKCMTGVGVTNGSIDCELGDAKVKCQPILDAAHGKGPFAACQPLGNETIEREFNNCAYDA
ncbi:unnamed protein product [Anisakis simplex]|uniref:Uncharacterized protein n=1 Tax=Anisakis simplex TaxID=6269 RepID=A0A3P6PY83_ANISI|nr:unnamed protein product [Anisakis simplex]